MKKLLMLMLAVGFLAACESRKADDQTDTDTTATAKVEEPSENQLTAAQRSEGWKLLFNGENMDGWKFYKGKENDSWEVADGTLHCKADEVAKKRADLRTVDEYENFELAFDWKVAPGDNSGVIYRSTEQFDEPYLSGPEYQVIDDKGYSDDLKDNQLSGANYDMHAATAEKKINPPGEWNSGRILVNGNHVEHWLNDVKVVEYELNSPEWKKLKNGSKWKDAKGYGAANKGFIDLQDHGGEVWYRNIMIKTL
jgi:hypothetical protein